MNAEAIIDDIIRREGGYVDHAADRGGPTNHGITLDTLTAWRGRATSADDVAALTEAEARRIYLAHYVVGPGVSRIENDALQALVCDCAVNHGVTRACRWLQQAAGVTDDGIIGPVTLAAVNDQDAATLYGEILATRAEFYGGLISQDPTQAAFARGWMARLAEFIRP